ncbi:flagellar basal-body MS-ring/collar protein FliF [Sphingosinicella sp.]|uniref:flagellar basal-body MS-ring/collar protein FliF n=1 Tax=Sphingosinicella sp. TaxID=1917971 RepID=UPI004037E61C
MATLDDRLAELGNGKQLRLVAFLLVGLTALLVAGYYFFLRADYAILFSDVRPADASAIVAELERRQISHDLRDGGTTILVPADRVAAAQIAIAGSNVPQRGMVGFELFNESDMGLTDFAQRINYQRALQGELARTIMQMDGIEAARVHLALPERSLFRGNRSEPRAAVTVTPKRGHLLDDARVAGIQRLVAAAIPELALENVVVLDDLGRVVSPAASADAMLSPEAEEEGAVRRYFRGRARQALATALPGVESDVRVAVAARAGAVSTGGWNVPTNSIADQPPQSRSFGVNILIVTPTSLGAEQQRRAREAVTLAVALDEAGGDSLTFRVGAIGPAIAAPSMADRLPQVRPASASPPQRQITLLPGWLWLLAIVVMVIGGAVVVVRRRGSFSVDLRDDFVARIRRELRSPDEAIDG